MITEEQKNLWSPDFDGFWRCILVNTVVGVDGCAVMGAGVAQEAMERFPWLPARYGQRLQAGFKGVGLVADAHLILFPTKLHWRAPSPLSLIRQSCVELRELIRWTTIKVVLPRPGCGLGGRSWADVEPIVRNELGDLKNDIVVVWQ